MPSQKSTLAMAASAAVARAATLNDICTTSYAVAALPTMAGITIDATSLTAATTFNSSTTSEWFPTVAIDCSFP